MGTIGRDDTKIHPLFQQTATPDAFHIGTEGRKRPQGFTSVGQTPPRCLFMLGFGEAVQNIGRAFRQHPFGFYPHQRPIHLIQQAAILHFGSCHKFSVVEPFGRKAHQRFVHAVLHGEQTHRLGMPLRQRFHQGGSQSSAHGFHTLHRGRQLTVVAGQNHAVGFGHGNPAGGFECLRRFVDEEGVKMMPREERMGCTGQGGSDDACPIEQTVSDA